MRHLRSGRKLNRSASHRKALFANLALALFDKERIITTLPKAKEMRSLAERLITYAKKKSLHTIRLASRVIRDRTILKKLFDDIAPSFADRQGGYTRIIKLGERRGDNALMAIIELVGRGGAEIAAARKKSAAKAAPQAGQPAAAEGAPAASEAAASAAEKKEEAPKPEKKAAPRKKAIKDKKEKPTRKELPKGGDMKAMKRSTRKQSFDS
jgi:large subunit ribosomal protein L17